MWIRVGLVFWVVGFHCGLQAYSQPAAPEGSIAEKVSDQVAPVGATAPMRLRLKNNGFGVGKIVPSSTPAVIGWQNEGFSEPFFFDVDAVRSISTLQAADQSPVLAKSLFLIESTDGQSLTAEVIGLDAEWLTVRSAILGELKLPVGKINQLIRADYSGEIIYPGLSQQSSWTPIGAARDWEIRAGILTATKQGAAIVGDVKLPEKCEISISLAWRGVPDFVVSFGAGAGERNSGQVLSTARLEIWNRNIVLVRETDKDADLKRLTELSEKNPQIELNILMDQVSGLVVVQDVHGRQLGKLQVRDKNPRIGPSIHIVNHGPSLTVERLEVRRWNGSSMLGADQSQQVVLGEDKAMNDSWLSQLVDGQFVVESRDGSKTNVPMNDVMLAGLKAPDQSSTTTAEADQSGSRVEVILSDRSRLKGQWQADRQGSLSLHSQWCNQDLSFPVEHAFGVIGTDERFSAVLTEHRNGILKIGESELAGYLLEDVTSGGAKAIRWQPHGSQSASSVDEQAEGSIAYRLQLPISASGQPTGRIDDWLNQPRSEGQPNDATKTPPETQTVAEPLKPENASAPVTREIVFASGDTIDGYVERADEKGVYFLSEQTQVRFVEHSRLDRLWLNSMSATVKKAANEKIQRLMTVPRALKDDPPTHLLISVNGDFLRGRLVTLSDKSAQFDVRSTVAEIPREKIAQIIWLHQKKWIEPTEGQPADPASYSIHVVQQERGLTFCPTQVVAGVVHGQSQLLGSCQISVKQISQILFGPNLRERVLQFRDNPWVLSLAQLPRAYSEKEADEDEGVESPLVGKPAPPFNLSRLDGQSVRLSSLEGKIVVLDFWASWCGPCMKSLPIVHEVLANYDPNDVQLIAVNIQETEARIQSAVEKLSLYGTVALDRDGEVAASYQATSIPQTVIIDKSGLVRFVFVGSSNEFGANLRDAIDGLLSAG